MALDDRATELQREYDVAQAQVTPKEIGGVPPVRTLSTNQEAESKATATGQEQNSQQNDGETIMVPKYRFDEINRQYQQLKDQTQSQGNQSSTQQTQVTQQPAAAVTPAIVDINRLVDERIAPIKVQLEVDRVMKQYDDFEQFAPNAINRIRTNPSLSLEEAYQLEKFSHLQSMAKDEGKKEAYENVQKKASLQVERTGRKGESPSIEQLVSDRSVPLSEIERMLPHG